MESAFRNFAFGDGKEAWVRFLLSKVLPELGAEGVFGQGEAEGRKGCGVMGNGRGEEAEEACFPWGSGGRGLEVKVFRLQYGLLLLGQSCIS